MERWCIGHVDSERGFSGGEVQVFLLLEGLRQRGHRVVLFCRPGSRSAAEAERRGIEHITVPMANNVDWRGFTHLARAFREFPLDLVHLHTGRANWLGGLAAWRSGIPAVSTRRMDRKIKPNWRNRVIYGRFLRRVISISPAVTECLRQGGVWLEKIDLIPEAVDPARVQPRRTPAEVRAELGASDSDCVLLAMAALVARKGIDVLLMALAMLSAEGLRPRLWVAGDGPRGGSLRAQAEELGLADQVRFLGERQDSADLLQACDVFVMPSRREGLGVAALEAMAMARPVVCSKVGGLAFSVAHEQTGLQVPADDPEQLAVALARLSRDPELRASLGAAGPARAADVFSVDKMLDAHLALYRRVLASAKK